MAEESKSNKRSVESGQDTAPETPKKKRKLGSTPTPKSSRVVRTPQKLTTPSHRRYGAADPLSILHLY